MRPIKIPGKTIGLAPVSYDDIDDFQEWFNDLETTDWIINSTSVVTYGFEEGFIAACEERSDKRQFSIVMLDDGTLIGNCSINSADFENGTCELGIVIGNKEHRSKGAGTEAISLLLDFCFMVLRMENVGLKVLADNERALKCYHNAGMKEYAHRHKSAFVRGAYRDEIYMEMLRENWLEMRKDGICAYSEYFFYELPED